MNLHDPGSLTYRVKPHPFCSSVAASMPPERKQNLVLPKSPAADAASDLPQARGDREEWLGVVAHELRGPAASIHNAIRSLRSASIDATSRLKMQALIERQVGRLLLLLDDLTDLTRLTRAPVTLRTARIDLRTVLQHALETAAPDITQRKHRLEVVLPDSPVWISGDAGRLEQVFVNLLANASKYTHAGGEISVWLHAKAGHAVVRIRDSGIGIATDMLTQIFDMFRQTDAAIRHSNAGSGIGLAVVRNFVELHGGRVTAASAGRDQGSEFTVQLPRPPAEASIQPVVPALPNATPNTRMQSNKNQIA